MNYIIIGVVGALLVSVLTIQTPVLEVGRHHEVIEVDYKPIKAKKFETEVASVKEKAVVPDVEQASAKISGSKQDWLKASGIPQSQWGLVDYLVSKESGWNPNAVNASSGACGLGQQLPCGKWAGTWNNPIDALKAMNGYVMGRYGSWQSAVNHSKSVGWY